MCVGFFEQLHNLYATRGVELPSAEIQKVGNLMASCREETDGVDV